MYISLFSLHICISGRFVGLDVFIKDVEFFWNNPSEAPLRPAPFLMIHQLAMKRLINMFTLWKWSNLTFIFFNWVSSTTTYLYRISFFQFLCGWKDVDVGTFINETHCWFRNSGTCWYASKFHVSNTYVEVKPFLGPSKNGRSSMSIEPLKNGPWLGHGYIGDEKLSSYIGIIS